MKILLYIISIICFYSCKQEHEKTTVINPFDSSFIAYPSFVPKTQDTYTYQFTCGTAELAFKMFQDMNWSGKFEKRLITKEFLIKKKNVYSFINLINKTDSLKVVSFKSWWLDSFDEDKKKNSPNETYVSISYHQDEIYVLKTGINDSVPILLNFNADFDNRLIMKVQTDSSVFKTITNILINNKFARPISN